MQMAVQYHSGEILSFQNIHSGWWITHEPFAGYQYAERCYRYEELGILQENWKNAGELQVSAIFAIFLSKITLCRNFFNICGSKFSSGGLKNIYLFSSIS